MQQVPRLDRYPVLTTAGIVSTNQASALRAAGLSPAPCASHHLFFASLFDPGRALSFPCDDCGSALLDELSERARSNYFFARTCVGRDYGTPRVITVQPGSHH